MNEKNKTDQFIDHINSHILPFIDYSELQASYGTDMVYAKGILNRLHEAMVSVYGNIQLDEMDGDDGFVIIPGVVCGRNSGNICLALLELDLSSSGEHWGTSYLCKYGVISQSGGGAASNNGSVLKAETKEINAAYLPYDYGYTAVIPDDIHVNKLRLPEAIKSVLNDFRKHGAELLFEEDAVQGVLDKNTGEEKSSVKDQIRQHAKDQREQPPAPKDTPTLKTKKSHKKAEPEL